MTKPVTLGNGLAREMKNTEQSEKKNIKNIAKASPLRVQHRRNDTVSRNHHTAAKAPPANDCHISCTSLPDNAIQNAPTQVLENNRMAFFAPHLHRFLARPAFCALLGARTTLNHQSRSTLLQTTPLQQDYHNYSLKPSRGPKSPSVIQLLGT